MAMRNFARAAAFAAAFAASAVPAAAQKAYVLPSPTDANAELTLYINLNNCEDGIQNNGLKAIVEAFPDTSLYLWTWQPAGPAAGNGNWDDSAEHQKLTKVGPGLYSMTFVPTAYYGVDGPALFARGISCLAKLDNGNSVDGFPFEAKSEDIHIDIIPKLCEARICVFPELRNVDDFVSITYDNSKETREGLQNMGADECFFYMIGKVDAFTSYEIAAVADVPSHPELQVTAMAGTTKFRTNFIPEELFADFLQPGEKLSEIWYYVVRPGFSYPPGPPPFEILSLLDCE
jgi:hypothetical protein